MPRAIELHVERAGTHGPTIVLCHGFGGSARNFRPQARALRDRARVVAYDARGHARSPAPDDPKAYTPEQHVADMLAIVDASGVDTAVVGGLSMGAGIALRFAIAHPERTRALLLASFPRSVDDEGHREWAFGFADAIEERGLESAGEEFAWGGSLDAKGALLVRQGFMEHPPHGLVHTLRELVAVQPSVATLTDELRAIRVPTLIVAGSADARSLPGCRALSERIPGARLAEIEGGGHVVNLTHPAEFNDVVSSWLDEAVD